eukprot:5717682-Pleurochrysis_carterae.AAC.4
MFGCFRREFYTLMSHYQSFLAQGQARRLMASTADQGARQLGVLVNFQDAGCMLPDSRGQLPSTESGLPVVINVIKSLMAELPYGILRAVQVPWYPGTHTTEMEEVASALRQMSLSFEPLLIVSAGDPANPDDEDLVLSQLVPGLKDAVRLHLPMVSSATLEAWHPAAKPPENVPAPRTSGTEQLVRLHLRAHREAGMNSSKTCAWNLATNAGLPTASRIAVPDPIANDLHSLKQLARKMNSFLPVTNDRPVFRVVAQVSCCSQTNVAIKERNQLIRLLSDECLLGSLRICMDCTMHTCSCGGASRDLWAVAEALQASFPAIEATSAKVYIDHSEPITPQTHLRMRQPWRNLCLLSSRKGQVITSLAKGISEVAELMSQVQARQMNATSKSGVNTDAAKSLKYSASHATTVSSQLANRLRRGF